MPSKLRYRAGQFRRSIGARPSQAALRRARLSLNDRQWALFQAMSPRDQWHAIETADLLGAAQSAGSAGSAGSCAPDFAVAALLHDAGKGYIRLHERGLYVLLGASPPLLRLLARSDRPGLRGALHRTLHHADIGARLALASGASERAAQLIRTHHRPDPDDAAALALLDADDRA